ncbi:tRNA (guanosine(37)-N1)-methyltransferase TrmD [Candidatus Peregrinibacteria bacterium]|nr:tRNA (guanosine(37)-N1)-methyltransferase TrmD [Candidatus Peregrinibacteria bacterium]
MRFDILTIFPNIFDSYISTSILRRAQQKKLIKIVAHDIRKFSKDKHHKVDALPFGGGAGMVMTPQPLYEAIKRVKRLNKGPVIYLTPRGKTFNQIKAEKLIKKKGLILICGHYEGIDQRIIDTLVDEEISVGDYVLTGGELPALIIVDAVSRLLPNVLHSPDSHKEESFSKALDRKKEYPHYTRPAEFRGMKVPKVLMSGNHKEIDKWRKSKLS